MSTPLYKSERSKVIVGVCGGIADYFGFNVTALRVLWVIGTFLAGTGLFLYLALVILMPMKGDDIY